MVWYFVILGLVAIRFGYDLLLSILSIKGSKRPIPENVKDVYSQNEYEKWCLYNKEHSNLGIISSITSFVISITLLATYSYSGFASLFGDNYYLSALGVYILYNIPSLLISPIFSYISTFKIEEKYGFNKTTKKTFIIDQIKDFLISFILFYGLISLFIALHQAMGVWMILLFTGILLIVILFITFIAPTLTRIKNKLTPLEDGELRTKLTDLLTKNGYSVKEIQVMDASKRTTKVNAMFAGFGKMKSIILYDNLINTATDDEILAVFAHELGHGKHKDTIKGYFRSILMIALFSLSLYFLAEFSQIYTAFHFSGINYAFLFILFMDIILGVVAPFISVITNYFSRKAEYGADKFAKDEGYGDALISALKKLTKENFGELNPHPLIVKISYSHPTLSQRIENVNK